MFITPRLQGLVDVNKRLEQKIPSAVWLRMPQHWLRRFQRRFRAGLVPEMRFMRFRANKQVTGCMNINNYLYPVLANRSLASRTDAIRPTCRPTYDKLIPRKASHVRRSKQL